MIPKAEPTRFMDGKVSVADFGISDLFAEVPESILMECASRAELVRFPRGSILVREGDPADAMYILLTGRVEVIVERAGGADILVDILRAGECLGDLALLLGQRRTATARAVRDCSAARIGAEDFAWLIEKAPGFTIRLARIIADRLQRTTHPVRKKPIEKIAALSVSSGMAIDRFCAGLEEACAAQCPPIGRSPLIDIGAISGVERMDQYTVAVLRDADLIFIVGESSRHPETERIRTLVDLVADFRPRPEVHLALLQGSDPPYRGTLPWLQDRRIRSWHHVRLNQKEDFNRVTRRITGQAVGVALSGGGARSFAHIGVLKAITEMQIPIDFIAGSSMGAIVAAQYAIGFNIDRMLDLMHRSYVRKSLPDFTIPYVALYTGTATSRRLKHMFGQARIEDLQTPYFCVSSNLNTADTVVHERGKLWYATRSSCSVPGLLPPIRTRRGLLVDGGLLDNLPVVEMSERFSGHIIASDVSVAVESQRPVHNRYRRRRFSTFSPPNRLPRIGYILMRSAQLASVRDSRQAGVPAALYLHPPVDDVGMNDFGRLHEIVQRAASYAQLELAQWSR
jgi:predicted acylesterase/phospholipase RssA/CRP-like cAMP-binding protein